MNALLRLPEQPPVAWARLLPEGGEGGGAAYEIDASGLELRNRMVHYSLLSSTTDARTLIRVRLTSTMVATHNGFEGLAPRLRGFRLTGAIPAKTDEMVVDTNPEAGGKKMWYAGQNGTWDTRSFIIDWEDYENHEGIDYYTVEFVLRAQSGQVKITNVECQNLYSKEIQFAQINGKQVYNAPGLYYDTVESVNDPDEEDIRRWLRDLDSKERFIPKGKRLVADGGAIAKGEIVRPTVGLLPSSVYGYFKMRIAGTGQYDYYEIGESISSDAGKIWGLKWTLDSEARNDYDLVIHCIGMAVSDTTSASNQQVNQLVIYGDNTKLMINDFVAPSQ